jgi:hypothetical protein
MDMLEEHKDLWNRQSGWQLYASRVHQYEVTIIFVGDKPSVREINSVRKLGIYSLAKKWCEQGLRAFKAEISAGKELNLGVIPGYEMRKLETQAAELGLTLRVIDRSITQYLPFHPKTQSAVLLHTPDDVTQQIIQNMLDAGVPVVYNTEID